LADDEADGEDEHARLRGKGAGADWHAGEILHVFCAEREVGLWGTRNDDGGRVAHGVLVMDWLVDAFR